MSKTSPQMKPDTQANLTKNEISYSVKIAKQTIRSNLEEQIKGISKAHSEIFAKFTKLTTEEDIEQEITNNFMLELDNDSTMYKLTDAYNLLNEEQLQSTSDLVTNVNLRPLMCLLFGSMPNLESLDKILEKEELHIDFNIALGVLNKDEIEKVKKGKAYPDEHLDCEMGYTIVLPLLVKEFIETKLPLMAEIANLQKQRLEIENKLEDIPNTLEEIEAQLLIQELGNTDKGKKVLDITGDIINNVVNKNIKLLE